MSILNKSWWSTRVILYIKSLGFAHLNKGDGLAWASQNNVTAWPWTFQIPSNLDLGGNRGGLLPTGSKNEKGERFTSYWRNLNQYLHTLFSLNPDVHVWQDADFHFDKSEPLNCRFLTTFEKKLIVQIKLFKKLKLSSNRLNKKLSKIKRIRETK